MSAYIGNSPQFGVFRKLDALTFNGSTTTFNILSGGAAVAVGDPAQLFISLNGVIQEPGAAYTLANGGTQVVFSSAPTSGMSFFGIILGVKGGPVVNDGEVTPAKLDRTYATPADVTTAVNSLINNAPGALDTLNELATALGNDASFSTTVANALNLRVTKSSSTGSALVPVGTTAQRDGTPAQGYFRFNTSTNQFEGYNGTAWGPLASGSGSSGGGGSGYSVDYLVVAGGGGGGYDAGGGGGAGGYLAGTTSVVSLTGYAIVVGAGGTAGTGASAHGGNGANSSAITFTAIGGGGGGTNGGPQSGNNGGSGGGASIDGGNQVGSGTTGQGNAGSGGTGSRAGCGGGKNAAGGNNGGDGLAWSNGTTYAGGGGGGCNTGTYSYGGAGGGGAGATYAGSKPGPTGTAGTANTGGGGGGGAGWYGLGAQGGSGIVIIRYSGSQVGSGGTVTSAGGYTYHTFTSSGTFTA